jgi:hypothetical protein
VASEEYVREFDYHRERWRVRRQIPVWAGRVPPGGTMPYPPPAGLIFVSECGEHRLLHLSGPFEILTDEELVAMPENQLIDYLERAEQIAV